MSKDRLFGTDGVRGVANIGLTATLALQLGRATGYWVQRTVPPALTGCPASSVTLNNAAPSANSASMPYAGAAAPPFSAMTLMTSRPTIIIGRDTRLSGDMLEAALAAQKSR